MKVTKNPFIDNAIYFGLITAGIGVVTTLLYYLLDVNFFNWMFSILNFVILIVIYVIIVLQGIKKYRLGQADQKITYWNCVFQSFLIMLIGGILTSIFSFLFYHFFDPEYMVKQVANFANQMQQYGLPEEQLDEMMANMESRMTPLSQLKNGLIFQPIFGFVLALIISAFAKKKENTFEGNFN